MKRLLIIVAALVTMACADLASARGSHSGSHSHHMHRAVIVSAVPVFFGVPFAGYYPAPYYAPPYMEPSPATSPSTTPGYATPGEPHFFCPDSRQYYPAVTSCPTPWLKVVP